MALFDPQKMLLIAGPCSLESKTVCRSVAKVLQELQEKHHGKIKVIFKGSFDKANRTSSQSKRGPGQEEGLSLLQMVRSEYHLPVTTDIHQPDQAEIVGKVVDVLQIPAFLCRQTDLLEAAAKTQKCVSVKKGQFLSPQEMEFVVKKLENFGAQEILQMERGTFFGYGNLVVDMRSFSIMKEHGHPTIFDASHSVMLPGAGKGKSSGETRYIGHLAKAALAAGAQGLFIETHPNPEEAISDADSQVRLSDFEALIESCLPYWELSIFGQ